MFIMFYQHIPDVLLTCSIKHIDTRLMQGVSWDGAIPAFFLGAFTARASVLCFRWEKRGETV